MFGGSIRHRRTHAVITRRFVCREFRRIRHRFGHKPYDSASGFHLLVFNAEAFQFQTEYLSGSRCHAAANLCSYWSTDRTPGRGTCNGQYLPFWQHV